MPTHNVIIGGGPVATNALETIRQYDAAAQITLICDEPAHSRMALPYWLSGQIPREQTHTADEAYFKKLNVDAKIGSRVQSIDPGGNSVTLCDGSTLSFDNLLIATGSSPLGLPVPGVDLPGVQPLWSLEHTESLLKATAGNSKPKVVMIGAGFIGFIMLNAMHKKGWDLAVVEKETQVLPRMLNADAAGIVQSWLGTQGVGVHTGVAVQGISEAGDGSKVVELSDGNKLSADVVIVATGVKSNLDLVDGSGIKTADGILVNEKMQTNFPNIYAGGDVAQGLSLYGGQELHSIQPTAVDHGRIAGANMAGQDKSYPGSLLMNILDACGLQNASFGNWDDAGAEAITICSPEGHVYRKLLVNGDEITGAMFTGRANDVGMLTDIGMVKGLMQTRTKLGQWKQFLKENPFDIRRPYIATKVAAKLAKTTLLGKPSQARQFRYGNAEMKTEVPQSHSIFMNTK